MTTIHPPSSLTFVPRASVAYLLAGAVSASWLRPAPRSKKYTFLSRRGTAQLPRS
jgi:hypothetical protein